MAEREAQPQHIENAFDVQLADQLAKQESYNKHLYRPNTYLHKWWARRCGTTFRAILKHLSTKPDFYSAGGLEGKIILDPMMGGGTTLHEAIRLGANVIGADIDPIPILQARATLSDLPLNKSEQAFDKLFKALYQKLAHCYRARCPHCQNDVESRFVLYGLRQRCDCKETLLLDSFKLRYNSDDSIIHIDPDTGDILHNEKIISKCTIEQLPLRDKKGVLCDDCGGSYLEDVTIPYHQRYLPICIVGECAEHGIFFAAPSQADLDLIAQADKQRASVQFDDADFTVAYGPKSSQLIKREIRSYLDLFSSRQLLFLQAATEAIAQLDSDVRLKLALLLSTATEFNSMLCGYKGAGKSRPGAIRHTFAHHAYSFPSTALENNPLHQSRSSGTLINLFQSRIVRGRQWAMKPIERKPVNGKLTKVAIQGEVDAGTETFDVDALKTGTRRFMLLQGSSAQLDLPDNTVDHVVTDPPYFDSVQYGDLAAFFRVWLRQFLPNGADWEYQLSDSAIDQQADGDGQYVTVLSAIFAECCRVLKKENGRFIFTFHHWNPKGWAALTHALKSAGFVLLNRYVVHAENRSSVHIANQNALIHDVIFVLASAETTHAPTVWEAPIEIDRTDSYTFCLQCGTLLGHLLSSDESAEAINATWQRLLTD